MNQPVAPHMFPSATARDARELQKPFHTVCQEGNQTLPPVGHDSLGAAHAYAKDLSLRRKCSVVIRTDGGSPRAKYVDGEDVWRRAS